MNSFKLKARISASNVKLEAVQMKIDIANSGTEMKIKTLELGIEKCKTDLEVKIKALELGIEKHRVERDGKTRMLNSKRDDLNKEIQNDKILLREQREVEADGMGRSLNDNDE